MPADRLFRSDRVSAIAHRGGSKLRPENTRAAFEHALSLGVDGLECDVHLSRDGVPVVIHDPTLDRTTEASGPVAARTAAELSGIDAGFRFGESDGFPFRGRGVRVPALAEMLDLSADTPVIVEFKGEDPAIVPPVLEVVRRARRPDRVMFGGFSHAVLEAARALAPDVPTSASRVEIERAIRRAYFRLGPGRTGCTLFQVPIRFHGREILTAGLTRILRRAGYEVHSWIIDDPDEMRRVSEWGVTGVISDRPDMAVAFTSSLVPRPSSVR
jgi:glycerophosphoryl diester phosphodiesterase